MNYENLKEQSTHGNTLLPLHVYTHLDNAGHYSVNSHWHQEFEIIYVEKGKFKLMIDMNSVTLKSGQYLCINSGEVHSMEDTSASESKSGQKLITEIIDLIDCYRSKNLGDQLNIKRFTS